ncbi:hypothetical protein C8J38_1011004 [Rhizobium sp. PP-WC-2G-219]|nr:hypothetical protein C8J32_101594 [Rhizobium sp. PP-CC-3A-592]PYE46195.1 hypothetical protein DFI02_101334 [Rhizobium sp. PP-F2F-G20b]TCL96642.1 hypothetical protein C8J38_1011004 [Rhizobium sp. PP-WC-2G-219]
MPWKSQMVMRGKIETLQAVVSVMDPYCKTLQQNLAPFPDRVLSEE